MAGPGNTPPWLTSLLLIVFTISGTIGQDFAAPDLTSEGTQEMTIEVYLLDVDSAQADQILNDAAGIEAAKMMLENVLRAIVGGGSLKDAAFPSASGSECMVVMITWLNGNPEALKIWQEHGEILEIQLFDQTTRMSLNSCSADSTVISFNLYMSGMSWTDNMLDSKSTEYQKVRDLVMKAFADLGGEYRQLLLADNYDCINIYVEWTTPNPSQFLPLISSISQNGISDGSMQYSISTQPCQPSDAQLVECPPVSPYQAGICILDCDDSDPNMMCPADHKCCSNGCGKVCVRVNYKVKMLAAVVISTEVNKTLEDKNSALFRVMRETIDYHIRSYFTTVTATDLLEVKGTYLHGTNYATMMVEAYMTEDHTHNELQQAIHAMEGLELQIAGATWSILTATFASHSAFEMQTCGSIECHGFCKQLISGESYCSCSDGKSAPFCSSFDCRRDVNSVASLDQNYCLQGQCESYEKFYYCRCSPGYFGQNCEFNVCDSMVSDVCSGHGTCLGRVDEGLLCQCDAGWSGIFCEQASSADATISTCERERRMMEFVHDQMRSMVMSPKLKYFMTTILKRMDLYYYPVPYCWDQSSPSALSGKYHSACYYDLNREGRLAYCECLDDTRQANGYIYFGQGDCRVFSDSGSVKHFSLFLANIKWSNSMAEQDSTYRQSILNQMSESISSMGASVSDVRLSKHVEGCVEVDVWYHTPVDLDPSSVYWMMKNTGLTVDGQTLSLSETGCSADAFEGSRLSFQFYVAFGDNMDTSVTQVGSSAYTKVQQAVEMAFSGLGGHLMEMELAIIRDGCVFAHVEWNTEQPSAIMMIMPAVVESGLQIYGSNYKVTEEACDSPDGELSLVTLSFYIMYGSTLDSSIADHSSRIYNDIYNAVEMEFSSLGGQIRQLELAAEKSCVLVHIDWDAEKPAEVIQVMSRLVTYGLMVADMNYEVSEEACEAVDVDSCPALDMASDMVAVNCGTSCSSDADCEEEDDSKCCQDSCGATSCTEVGYYDKLDVFAVVDDSWNPELGDEGSERHQMIKSLVESALDSAMRGISGYKSTKVLGFYPYKVEAMVSSNRERRQASEMVGITLVIKFTAAVPVDQVLRVQSTLMRTGLMILGVKLNLYSVQFGSEDGACGHVSCSENSLCVERRSQGHMCACSDGMMGSSCSVPIYTSCDKIMCINGGSCLTIPGGAYCDCPKGFHGLACEIKEEEEEEHCPLNMPPLMTETGEEQQCRMEPCPYGFTCEAEAADRWTACCFNEDFLCQTNPCQAGGSCVGDVYTGQVCSCPSDRGGLLCEEMTPDDLTRCEISQRFWNAIIGILSGEPSPITGLDMNSLRIILGHLHNEWLPVDMCDKDGNYKLVAHSVHYMNLQSTRQICLTELGVTDDTCGAATCDLLRNAVTPAENPCHNGGICVGDVHGKFCDCSSTGYHGFMCQHAGRPAEPETKCTLTRDIANHAISVVNNPQETQQMRDAMHRVLEIHGSTEETGVFIPSCDAEGNFEYRGCVLPRMAGQQTFCYCASLDGQMVGDEITLGQPPDNCPLLKTDGSCPDEWGEKCVKPHWWCDGQKRCDESERCMEVETVEGTRFECIAHDMDLPCEPKPCENNPYAHCSPCGEHGTCYHKVIGGKSKMPYDMLGESSEDDMESKEKDDDDDGADDKDKERDMDMSLPVLDYMCLCHVGYGGKYCDQNMEICNTIPETLCKHGCHGDIGQGHLCKCPEGMAGMLCNKPARSECEVRKALYDDAIAILSDELVIDGYDKDQMKDLIRFITETEGGETIPRLNCTKDGLYAHIQCEFNIETKSDYCRCSNQDGDFFSSNVEPYIDFDICKASGDPRELQQYLCEMGGSFCLNRGSCTMDVYNGQACDCREGFHGTFCEMEGDEKEESRSLCEFMANAFTSLHEILLSNEKATEQEKYAISNLTASFLFPMENLQYLKPECSEETGGFNSAAVCYYDLFTETKGNCYCWGSHGPDISRLITDGDEPLAICYTPKECGDKLARECPYLHCEGGYRKDEDGCDKCECMHPCETVHCKSDERCQLTKACHDMDDMMRKGDKQCAVCVPIHKPGICPNHNTASAYGSVIGGPLGLIMVDEEGSDDDDSMMEDEGVCPAKCRDDADCEGPLKCCGLCGSQCVQPLETYLCSEERAKMTEYAEFLKTAARTLNEVSGVEQISASDTDMLQVLERVASVPSVWIPECEEDGYLFKPLQCDYSVEDLATSADPAPTKCFCVDRLGHRLNGTNGVDHKDPEACQTKAGECPYLTSGHHGEQDSVPMCSSDVDCLGGDKCCSDGVRKMCTRPHPKPHMTLVDEVMSNLCMYNASLCNGYRCDSSTWMETGQSCHCDNEQDLYGPFCGVRNKEWHPSTVCEHKHVARLVFEGNFVLAESNPQGIVVAMEHYIRQMYEMMPYTYNWEKEPLDMVMVECTADGHFAPMQCVRDVRTWTAVACYCVDRDGHELVGTRRSIKDGKPQCGEPDEVSCPKGFPLHHQDGSLLQCGENTDHCPAGYECTMAAYGRQFCCLSSHDHTDVCQLPPDIGTDCEENSAKTYYYFDGKECVSFTFKGCGGNRNAFTSMSACQAKCKKVAHYGSCPAELFHVNVVSSTEYPCEDMCTEDDECEDTHKCCRSTCGRRCFPAVDNTAEVGQCPYGQPTQRCSSRGRVCPPDQSCYMGACCRDVKQDTNLCSVPPPMSEEDDDCRANRTRFFYNATSGMCEKFYFSGCRPEFNNFATEEECCEACNGKGRCKTGLCSEIKQGSAGTCRNECERDGNCPGKKICCSNGCASVCVVPQAENPSDCWERHHAAQKRKDIASHSSECDLVDVPECDSRGFWSREQCHKAIGVCWCVTPRGHYVNNTMTHGHANCDDLTTYEINIADRLRVDPATTKFEVCPDPEAELHCCEESLCDRSCTMNPRATCRINPCGGCQAEYFHDGVKVNCDRGLSQCETELKTAAKVVQEQLITAELLDSDDGDDDLYNKETRSMDRSSRIAPRAIYPGLPIRCQLPPETGPCRGLARQWYYDPGLARCDMFIWGMCQGNDNRFNSPSECYHTCDQNADPCKDKTCPYGQTCQHVFDKNCYWREKVCNVTAVCQATEPPYEIVGVYIPRCRANGEFSYKQCHDKFCWCVDANGDYVNGLTTAGSQLTCASDGATEDSVIELEGCPNDEHPNIACIKECTQHVCPGQPKAHCKVDMCSDNCAVTFVDDEGLTADCSDDVCDIFKFDEDEEEEECKAKKLECASGGVPQHCPESLCHSSATSCTKNPCAVCHLDPCTCQPYFLDSITGERLTQDQCDFVSLGSCRAQTCMILRELEAATLSNITLYEDDLILPTCDQNGDFVATQCIMGDCVCVDVYGVQVEPEADGTCKEIEKLVKMELTLRFEADLNKLRAENKEEDFINAIKLKFISLGTNPANLKIGPLYEGSIMVNVEVDDNTDQSSGTSSQNLDLLANNIRQAIDTGNFDVNVGGEAFTLDRNSWSLTQKTAANVGGSTTARPVDDDDDSGLSDEEIIIIAAVAGGVGLLVLAIICYCVCCKRKQKAQPTRDDSFDHVRVAQPSKDHVYDKSSLYNPTFEEDGHYMKIRM